MDVLKYFRTKLDKKGFTLVELLLVIALLAVIGGVFVPRLFGTLDSARIKADTASAQNLAHHAELLISTGTIKPNTGLLTKDILELDNSYPKVQQDSTMNFVIWYTEAVTTTGTEKPARIDVFLGADAVPTTKPTGTALTTIEIAVLSLSK